MSHSAVVATLVSLLVSAAQAAPVWQDWIDRLGHDDYVYPAWITKQQAACTCKAVSSFEKKRPSITCFDGANRVDWRRQCASADSRLTYCVSKAWLLEHMPSFDLHFLPGAIAVNSSSMLDDVIAFALMADAAAPWAKSIPLHTKLALSLIHI